MSYKCKLCGTPQPAGTTMKKIVKMRTVTCQSTGRERTEVESETPVCAECYTKATGKALEEKYAPR